MTSPTIIDQPALMDFAQALQAITKGKKITKLEWQDARIYGHMIDAKLYLHQLDGINYVWQVSEGDIIGTDYVIVD